MGRRMKMFRSPFQFACPHSFATGSCLSPVGWHWECTYLLIFHTLSGRTGQDEKAGVGMRSVFPLSRDGA